MPFKSSRTLYGTETNHPTIFILEKYFFMSLYIAAQMSSLKIKLFSITSLTSTIPLTKTYVFPFFLFISPSKTP